MHLCGPFYQAVEVLLRQAPQRTPDLHCVWYHISGAFPCAHPELVAFQSLVSCLP